MKNLYITVLLLFLITNFSSCKAQQVYPLNTYPDDVQPGSYLKDLSNELDPYIGTWKSTVNGRNIIVTITKHEHYLFKRDLTTTFYQDALLIKYIITDLSGAVLQSNTNAQSEADRNFITSVSVKDNIVSLYYNGTNCGVGWGEILLKRINTSTISWSYYPNDSVLTTKNCPGNQNTTIYLPETENLIFTKQ
ncbi:hypothetical protein SAMN05421866_0140 [Chryseobacterium oranimense]|uniref:DUF6705 domain-containing protein n=1 Tax=Chryseobacterium oranimense TaxID=421058 RepID=A0A1M5J4I3_9FLAO|nr:DUF6705 family protein [Chryseobacterium oranimense]SHG35110.1 hypothetical protein SAMN05421866_0140 [Chryseobacterium oranimense]